jgi:hypothetical protein
VLAATLRVTGEITPPTNGKRARVIPSAPSASQSTTLNNPKTSGKLFIAIIVGKSFMSRIFQARMLREGLAIATRETLTRSGKCSHAEIVGKISLNRITLAWVLHKGLAIATREMLTAPFPRHLSFFMGQLGKKL